MLGRRASRLAPPRHRRGAWLGIPCSTPAPLARTPLPGPVAVWCRGLPRVRATERRALRGYGGRTEPPHSPKLSACATRHAHAHYPGGAIGTSRPTAITHRHAHAQYSHRSCPTSPHSSRPPHSPRSSPHRSIACGFAPPPRRPATAKTERMLPIFQDRSAREFTLSVREQFATISIPHFYRLFRRKLAKKTSERSYSRFFSSPCRDFQRRICSPNPPGKQQN